MVISKPHGYPETAQLQTILCSFLMPQKSWLALWWLLIILIFKDNLVLIHCQCNSLRYIKSDLSCTHLLSSISWSQSICLISLLLAEGSDLKKRCVKYTLISVVTSKCLQGHCLKMVPESNGCMCKHQDSSVGILFSSYLAYAARHEAPFSGEGWEVDISESQIASLRDS